MFFLLFLNEKRQVYNETRAVVSIAAIFHSINTFWEIIVVKKMFGQNVFFLKKIFGYKNK